jgi:dTDP-4-amino-4,6-dideoxygalactose transaminase/ribosomal protein S18 acetylase RimI-like enzyme
MIPLFKVFMSQDIDNIKDTLKSGMITQSKKVDEFEDKLKNYFNYPYILTLNSATSGLTLGIRLLNLTENDEVLCTPLTCMATTCAVLENRVKIKWVDVDPKTCNMDLEDLKMKISLNTKAVIFVHWGGSPIDLDKMKKITGNIPIVEDCAHSFGTKYKDTNLGTHGNIAVYSLQAIKHLTSGDGGLIFLPNKELYNRAKLLRWFGINREKPAGIDFRLENDIQEWGYKFHMNDINASIGLSNLPYIDVIIGKHMENAKYYNDNLQDINGVELLEQVPNSKSSYWLYTLKVNNKNDFIQFMTNKKITVSQVHNRNDIHSCVKEFKSTLPNMDILEKEIISIPVGWWVTNDNREYIVKCIKEWSENNFTIRKLKRTDKNEYLELMRQLNGYICNSDKFDIVFPILSIVNNDIYVLIKDSHIICTARVNYENKFYENVAHFEDIVTDINYRKKGYASLLLKYIIKQIKKKDCYKIVLNANDNNISFYKKNNFIMKGTEFSMYL